MSHKYFTVFHNNCYAMQATSEHSLHASHASCGCSLNCHASSNIVSFFACYAVVLDDNSVQARACSCVCACMLTVSLVSTVLCILCTTHPLHVLVVCVNFTHLAMSVESSLLTSLVELTGQPASKPLQSVRQGIIV